MIVTDEMMREQDKRIEAALQGLAAAADNVQVDAYRHGIALAEAKVSNWMMANGFATGHGETLDDLLRELTWQIEELREQRFSEVLRRSDGGAR